MSGAPIYLVSACTTGEEFISAFRRYADRNGVMFIPIAEPLPAGRKGRFALALTSGGVMIEGQAEVVSSAKTPSVLYGRVGMTVKFLAPDEDSRVILSELEKARTSLKPAPPSVPPRPATLPAEPRPRPPAPAGRIDAVNALAECIVIGDVSSLSRDSDLGTIPPPIGKQPSSPVPVPIATPKSAPVAKPPAIPAATRPPPFQHAPSDRSKPTTLPPAVPPLPATLTKPSPSPSLTATSIGLAPIRAPGPTAAPSAAPAVATPLGIAPPPPATAPTLAAPPVPATREEAVAAALKFAHAVEARGMLADDTAKGAPPTSTDTIRGTQPAAMNTLVAAPRALVVDDVDEKTDVAVAPPAPVPVEHRHTQIGVAVTPSGAHVLPAAPPRAPTDEETRPTTQIVAVTPGDEGLETVDQIDPLGSTDAAIRLSKLQPTVEEPSGDWTMSTNDGQLTISPRKPAADASTVIVEEPTPSPKSPPTGDYIIALDPSKPDGWSAPAKVEKRAGEPPPGPPVSAVASEQPLDSNARAQPEIATDEPKIQIDPTLIEPLGQVPTLDPDEDEATEPPGPVPVPPMDMPAPPLAAASVVAAPPLLATHGAGPQISVHGTGPLPNVPHGTGPMPNVPLATHGTGPLLSPPRPIANASGSNPVLAFESSVELEPSRAAEKRRRRRMTLIVGSVIAVIAIAAVAIAMTRGDSSAPQPSPATEAPPAPPPPPSPPTGAATPQAAPTTEAPAPTPPAPSADPSGDRSGDRSGDPSGPTPADEPAAEPAIAVDTAKKAAVVEPAAPTECTLTIASAPAEAELAIGGDDKGTTPVTLTLPCGEPVKLTLKKQRYQTLVREVTPKSSAKPATIKLALARTTFTVKVSSSPPGATVTLGGKVLGLTPTTVKVPAFEASTLKIAKDGYAPEMQKVTPKNNASAVSVTLKKTATKRR